MFTQCPHPLPMKSLTLIAMLATSAPALACAPLLDIDKRRLASDETVNLCDAYADTVVLIVNTASKCGYTPQFDGLEALHQRYQDQGFAVLGFPSDDFGRQEYANEDESLAFCRLTYGVQFPMFEHTHAAKHTAGPLYQGLGDAAGRFPGWNFHKYLIGRDGHLIADFPSQTRPDDAAMIDAIERAL